MNTEKQKLEEALAAFVPAALSYARRGPALAALALAEQRKADTAAAVAYWQERKACFERDRDETRARSREEIEELARHYMDGTGPSLWQRLTGGVKGLAGRHAIPETLSALGLLIEERLAGAREADRLAGDALGSAQEAAVEEEHKRLTYSLTLLLRATEPLMARCREMQRAPVAMISSELGSALEAIGFGAKWRGNRVETIEELRAAVERAVGEEVALG